MPNSPQPSINANTAFTKNPYIFLSHHLQHSFPPVPNSACLFAQTKTIKKNQTLERYPSARADFPSGSGGMEQRGTDIERREGKKSTFLAFFPQGVVTHDDKNTNWWWWWPDLIFPFFYSLFFLPSPLPPIFFLTACYVLASSIQSFKPKLRPRCALVSSCLGAITLKAGDFMYDNSNKIQKQYDGLSTLYLTNKIKNFEK